MDGATERTGYDIRLFEKPKVFSGTESEFGEFRFKLRAYLDVVDENFAAEMEEAEGHGGPIAVPAEEGTAKRGRALYALLAGLVSGRGMKILQSVVQRNGYEAWRRIVGEFAPRIVQRKLGALQRVLGAHLSLDGIKEDLLQWEAAVREYEELEGTMSVDMKIGVLIKALPAPLQQHMYLNAANFDGDYQGMRRVLDMYIRSASRWPGQSVGSKNDGVVDMEVDFIAKGKGKGAGGGKHKGKGGDQQVKKGTWKRGCGRKRPERQHRPWRRKRGERPEPGRQRVSRVWTTRSLGQRVLVQITERW